jgi:hypothetical protein
MRYGGDELTAFVFTVCIVAAAIGSLFMSVGTWQRGGSSLDSSKVRRLPWGPRFASSSRWPAGGCAWFTSGRCSVW